jgi:hypothetical protein
MKTVYVEPAWKLRETSYMQAFFLHPPEGYKFIASPGGQNRAWEFFSKFGISFNIQSTLAHFMPIQLVKSYIERFKQSPEEAFLTYAMDHIVLRNEPWILDMGFEPPYVLCGNEWQLKRFKDAIKKALYSKYLKKITFPIELGKEAFLYEYGKELREKTEIIYETGARAKYFEKNYNKGRVKILFVKIGRAHV